MAITGSSTRAADPLAAVLAAATLGLPLFVALALAAERVGSRPLSIGLGLLGVAALVGFALAWPHWTDALRFRRYAQLSIGFHLLVAFLPYLDGRESNGFWQFNRVLFLRFLSALLHSGVLFLGLVVALLALDKLFGIKVHGNTYMRLWLFISFLFNTSFFLGGVPENLATLDQRRDYPRALKVFSQFILIPLVAIYLAILTAYLVRVLVTGQWPSNWIGYLVSSVATVGILSLLLVHPLRDDEGHRWIGRYARWFYVALLPAVGMLLAAVWKRIDQYGVTEDRYFLAVLALWLAAISVAFLVRPRTGIRWIPMTLCALAFATFAGPLGAYSVSRNSQLARLRTLFEANQVLVNGVAKPVTTDVPVKDRKEMSGIVLYLLEAHGSGSLRGMLGETMPVLASDSLSVGKHRYVDHNEDARGVMKALGMSYVGRWETTQGAPFNYYRWNAQVRPVSVRGADFHVHLEGSLPAAFRIEDESWRLESLRGMLALSTPGDTLWFPMDPLVALARAPRADRDTTDASRFTVRSQRTTAMLVPYQFSGIGEGDSLKVHQMTGDLYLTLRR